ncbi:MAG: gluconate 2-dehydrogenase subunit 3 family protein [Cyclobacteriaceae bacterium]
MNRREAIQRTAMVLGYAVSAPAVMGILNGCKATPELAFTPVFLTEDQARIVTEVAEILIPKTDTPGAKDVGVPGFIDLMLKDTFKKEDQDLFVSGLTAFDEEAKKNFGDPFVDLEPSQQLEHVKAVHDAAIKARQEGVRERPFILMAKELTVLGFFTSEAGATQVLQYEAVPGAYHGCVPLAEVGKAWATS